MTRRGNPSHADFHASLRSRSVHRSSASSWRDAVRRGAIFASVFACHLMVLMRVLHPSWHQIEGVSPPYENVVLRLTFHPLPNGPAFSPAPASARLPTKTPSLSPTMASPKMKSAVVRQPAIGLPAAKSPSMVALPPNEARGSYQPGDFQTALSDARRTNTEHIPGTTTPLVGGIGLEARSSIKTAAHGVTEYIRCTDKQLQMENGHDQFSTPQLMDRALQLDDCGPHLGHTAADAAIDEVSHRAIFGD